MSELPFETLAYLYVGSRLFEEDAAYYRDVLGAEQVWRFEKFGARVAAYRLAAGPLLLIADHRQAPSSMPVFAVSDLRATVASLERRGWRPKAGPFEIPDGPCYVFVDPSGNEMAMFENVRPGVLEKEYVRR